MAEPSAPTAMPFDPPDAAADNARAAAVLRQLGHPGAPLLGSGVESLVFALGPDTVVKIYRAQDTAWQERCEDLVGRLAAAGPAFALPVTLDSGTVDGARYAIQRRIPGRALAEALPALRGAARTRALLSYLDAAEAIGRVDLTGLGEPAANWSTPPAAPPPATSRATGPRSLAGSFVPLLGRGPTPGAEWPDFLRAWAMSHLAHDEAGVREDVPQLDEAVARYHGALPLVADVITPRLVHGDYWAENVLLGDDGLVSGIADWSGNVLAGDPRVDVAQSIVYLDMLDGFTHHDVALLLGEAAKRHGRDFPRIVELYRLHFALVYAADCKHYDPLTYHWCVRHLRAAGAP